MRARARHGRGHFDAGPSRHFHALEDLPLLVQWREQVAEAAGALRRAQDQQAAGVQGVVHQRQELLLRLDIHVDQEVAAAEDVHLRKRRIDKDVLRRKDHQVADLFLDPVALVFADEESLEPLRGNVGGNARGKRALGGPCRWRPGRCPWQRSGCSDCPEASAPPGTP